MPSIFPDIDICPFTGVRLKSEEISDVPNNILKLQYQNPIIGKVIISHTDYVIIREKYLSNNPEFLNVKHIYIGIIRNHCERYNSSFEVKSNFIKEGYKEFDYPKDFKQKTYYFLNYLYNNGGNEYKSFILTINDYPLLYAIDLNEFKRIIEYLEDNLFVNYISKPVIAADSMLIRVELRLSKIGIEEIEKELPVMPMWELIKQDVFTGDVSIDDKISHAKKLFFKSDSTIEDKRSACETLSFILEPLREKLNMVIIDSDTSDFFNIVNNFDIRHNKDSTKQLEKVEQFEWIFYSLLNTIICYYKILESENIK